MKPAWLFALCVVAAPASAQDGFVAELEQRLVRDGSFQLNAHLRSNWSTAMVPLAVRTADCEADAVTLAMQLNRSADRKVSQAIGDAVRTATGKCMPLVLGLATPDEIPKYCRSIAAWRPAQTARELRRRIALIEADEALQSSTGGKACHASYWNELRNTRVGLRAAAPARAASKPAP